MQQTKSKWIVTVCRADLAIAAVIFLSYRNKNLIQATFLFRPNRPCLRNFFIELKKKIQKFLVLTKEQVQVRFS